MDIYDDPNQELLMSWLIDKDLQRAYRNELSYSYHGMEQWEQEQQYYYDSLPTPESNILHDIWAGAKRVVAKAFHRLR